MRLSHPLRSLRSLNGVSPKTIRRHMPASRGRLQLPMPIRMLLFSRREALVASERISLLVQYVCCSSPKKLATGYSPSYLQGICLLSLSEQKLTMLLLSITLLWPPPLFHQLRRQVWIPPNRRLPAPPMQTGLLRTRFPEVLLRCYALRAPQRPRRLRPVAPPFQPTLQVFFATSRFFLPPLPPSLLTPRSTILLNEDRCTDTLTHLAPRLVQTRRNPSEPGSQLPSLVSALGPIFCLLDVLSVFGVSTWSDLSTRRN